MRVLDALMGTLFLIGGGCLLIVAGALIGGALLWGWENLNKASNRMDGRGK